MSMAKTHSVERWPYPDIKWNPAEFGNCTYFAIDAKEVWIPGIAITNTFDGSINSQFFDKTDATVTLFYDGWLYWFLTGLLSTSCSLDMSYYPYDTQSCGIQLENIDFVPEQLKLTPFYFDMVPIFVDNNNIWTVVGTAVENGTSKSYSSELAFTIQIKRRSLYVLVNVAVPIVLLNILTLAVFFMPYEERINFCTTIFLTFMVLTSVIAEKLPESSETIPLLGTYAMGSMICSVMILFAMLVVNSKSQISENVKPRGSLAFMLMRLDHLLSLICNNQQNGCKLSREQNVQTKDYELATSNDDSNVQSKTYNNERLDDVIRDDNCDEKISDVSNRITKSWTRLTVVLDRLLLCVFVLLHFIAFTIVFIVIPILI